MSTQTPELPSVRHHYEPRGAAKRLFETRDTDVLLSGPAGTGKSRACLEKLHFIALLNPGMRGLIVRKTMVSLTSTGLVTWREKVVKEGLAHGVLHFYGGSREEPAQYRYANGSAVVIGGLDKPTKIMSSEYDIIFVQEATEATADDWEALTTRLRNGVVSFQQLIADCNPASPSHWLNVLCQRGDALMLYSRHQDNPLYYSPDGRLTERGRAYIEGKLGKLTGVRRKRLLLGQWAAAEGLVYDFDPAVHLVNGLPKGSEAWTRWWSVDFGYSNPFVCQMWAEDGDGRLWLYREIYKTQTLVEDHARSILRLVRRCATCCKSKATDHDCHTCKACRLEWTEPRPRAVICDHDAEDRATLERHLGMSTSPAKKTVSDGIQAVESRLKMAGDGKPRLMICRDARVGRDEELGESGKPTSTEEEITGYVWPTDVKPDKREAPVKEDDHGMDAMRYMVAELDWGGRPRVRVLG